MDSQDSSGLKIEATLYLWGELIDLEQVSKLLNTTPVESWRKGDPIFSGKTLKGHRKKGQWISPTVVLHSTFSADDAIEQLFAKIRSPPSESYVGVAGVDGASIGVIGIQSGDAKDIEFYLSNELLKKVSQRGCSIQFAFVLDS